MWERDGESDYVLRSHFCTRKGYERLRSVRRHCMAALGDRSVDRGQSN